MQGFCYEHAYLIAIHINLLGYQMTMCLCACVCVYVCVYVCVCVIIQKIEGLT